MSDDFIAPYQWNYRPQRPARPDWFRSWPGDARIAVSVIMLHEWESVPYHRARPMPANSHHKFDVLALGGREYGARHGVWRLLDILDGHGVKASVVTSGLMAEVFPETVLACHQRGHEVASHQWDQCVFPTTYKSREEERENLVRSKAALEKTIGERIQGYMSPGPRPTPHTLDLIAELGFRWTCDYVDSDIPYTITVGDRQLVSVGYCTPGCLDAELMGHGAANGLEELKYVFDSLYAESRHRPMKFCYAVHTHWGGTPGMGRMLDDLLGFIRTRPGVWFARCGDVADFWNAGAGAAHAVS